MSGVGVDATETPGKSLKGNGKMGVEGDDGASCLWEGGSSSGRWLMRVHRGSSKCRSLLPADRDHRGATR